MSLNSLKYDACAKEKETKQNDGILGSVMFKERFENTNKKCNDNGCDTKPDDYRVVTRVQNHADRMDTESKLFNLGTPMKGCR